MQWVSLSTNQVWNSCEMSIFSAIDNEYNGPSLEDGKVTLKFVTDLMECYKNQGKLHKKFAYKVSGRYFNYCYNYYYKCIVFGYVCRYY